MKRLSGKKPKNVTREHWEKHQIRFYETRTARMIAITKLKSSGWQFITRFNDVQGYALSIAKRCECHFCCDVRQNLMSLP